MVAEAEAEAAAEAAVAAEAAAAAEAAKTEREDAYKGSIDPRRIDDGAEAPSYAELLRQGEAPRPYYEEHLIKKLSREEMKASQNYWLDRVGFTRKWRLARDAWRVTVQAKVDRADAKAAIRAASAAARAERAAKRAAEAERKRQAASDREVEKRLTALARIRAQGARAEYHGQGALYATHHEGQAPTTLTLAQAANKITPANLKRARNVPQQSNGKRHTMRCAACNILRVLPQGSARPTKGVWVCEHAGDEFECGKHRKRAKQ